MVRCNDCLFHTGLVLYSCGLGQALAAPGAAISAITEGILSLKRLIM